MKTIHKVGLGIAAGTLAVGGIAGASLAQADPTATPTPTASGTAAPDSGQRDGRGKGGDHGQRGGGVDAAALAEKLGLDEATVQGALDTLRDTLHAQRQDGTDPEGARPDRATQQQAMAEALASELGVSTEQVTTALTEIRADRDADRRTAFAAKLDQAVTDGTLTRAEADAVAKAADAGVIGYDGGRGGR